MAARISKSISMTGISFTLEDLKDFLLAAEHIADDARINISVNPGDYGQGDYYTISVSPN